MNLIDTTDLMPGYVAPYTREEQEADKKFMVLTPWTVQNVCYEMLANYMELNTPQSLGYSFSQKYDRDPTKTTLFLDIGYNYKDSVVQKRPAIFVTRGAAQFKYPTINQAIAQNYKDSEVTKYGLAQMPIMVDIIATNVGFAELVAQYIFTIFLKFAEVIRKDFNIRQFLLQSISEPALYLESKDHFKITLQISTAFDMGYVIKGDDLRLKTVAYTIFTDARRVLTRQ